MSRDALRLAWAQRSHTLRSALGQCPAKAHAIEGEYSVMEDSKAIIEPRPGRQLPQRQHDGKQHRRLWTHTIPPSRSRGRFPWKNRWAERSRAWKKRQTVLHESPQCVEAALNRAGSLQAGELIGVLCGKNLGR